MSWAGKDPQEWLKTSSAPEQDSSKSPHVPKLIVQTLLELCQAVPVTSFLGSLLSA